jgi:hypothetical protein
MLNNFDEIDWNSSWVVETTQGSLILVASGFSVFRVPGFGSRTRQKYAGISLIW